MSEKKVRYQKIGTAFFSSAFLQLTAAAKLYACDVSDVMIDWMQKNVVPSFPNMFIADWKKAAALKRPVMNIRCRPEQVREQLDKASFTQVEIFNDLFPMHFLVVGQKDAVVPHARGR